MVMKRICSCQGRLEPVRLTWCEACFSKAGIHNVMGVRPEGSDHFSVQAIDHDDLIATS